VKRILVLGSAGAGKSTFAVELGKRLGIEAIHLDSHYWQPNWKETPADEWNDKVAALLQADSWVMDGNYISSLPQRVERADTAIFIDRGRTLCLLRCMGRFLKYVGRTRPELPKPCKEKMDWDFIRWIWNYPRDVKPEIMRIIESRSEATVVILRSNREIAQFLDRVKVTAQA